MSLFGNTSSGGRGTSKNLVEFKAGKMTLKNTTVTADKRKGQLYIYQAEDGLLHLCWKDRKTSNVEDDLIIFPGDCEFKRVPQCTTGRVYLLRFKNPSRKFFFWMQEPKSDKDEELCKKVNDSMNNPPSPGSQDTEGAGIGGNNLQELFSNMDQQQFLQLMSQGGVGASLNDWLGAAGGGNARASRTQRTPQQLRTSTVPSANRARSTATPSIIAQPTDDKKEEKKSSTKESTPSATSAASSAGPKSPGVQLAQLQDILSEMGVTREPVDLSEAITPEVMAPILTNSEVQERLKPFLPKDESLPSDSEELKQTVHSPQFRQAMRTFSAALSSGQLGPVMKQFGLSEAAQTAANTGDVEAFAKAMQENTAPKEDEKME